MTRRFDFSAGAQSEIARRAANSDRPRIAGTLRPRWPDSHTTQALDKFLALRRQID